MSKFTVQGMQIEIPDGSDIKFENNQLYINGQLHVFPQPLVGIVKVVYEGNLLNLKCDRDVECGPVKGNVGAAGDVDVNGDVGGNVSATGDVTCGQVAGSISGTGDVTCGNVGGKITTTGDVSCRK